MTPKVIMHVDLNAFFVRCEEIKDPSLENKPVAIGNEGRGGIVSTCSYAARKYKVHSGQPMYQAKQLCPFLIIKPVDFKFYELMSNEFFAYCKTFTSKVQILSVDECFLDITDELKHISNLNTYLSNFQKGLFNKLKLKCSIGVAPTKFLAKMGSDLKKPMGITTINKTDISRLLYPQDVSTYFGIGKKSVPRLNEAKIFTIGDLADFLFNHMEEAKEMFGKRYIDLVKELKGESSNQLDLNPWNRKSIGHSFMLKADTDDYDEIKKQLKFISSLLETNCKKEKMYGKTLSVNMKTPEFKLYQKSITTEEYIKTKEQIFSLATNLYKDNYLDQTVRQVGISISNLVSESSIIKKVSIFDEPVEENDDIYNCINKINKKYNKKVLIKAKDLKK